MDCPLRCHRVIKAVIGVFLCFTSSVTASTGVETSLDADGASMVDADGTVNYGCVKLNV